MSPLYLEFLGAILRWLLASVGAYLVAHHVITADMADSLTTDLTTHLLLAVPIVAPLLWSLWAKWRQRLKVIAASQLPAHASDAEIAEKATAPSVKAQAFTTL